VPLGGEKSPSGDQNEQKGFAKTASLGSYHQPKRTQGDYRSSLRGPPYGRNVDSCNAHMLH
jgi:hypothetical protein